jgi:GNAT superfamily N-acetyltransferase
MVEIKHCSTESDFSSAIQITKDCIRWLNMDLSFQNIDKELSDFPSMYGHPNGLFLLAWHRRKLAGGVGLRMLETKVCEMKRLFVYDQFKSKGVGRNLCAALIQEAINLGYEKMRLDTLGRMKAAIRLYENLEFKEIDPYRFNPDPTTKYMELSLSDSAINAMHRTGVPLRPIPANDGKR